MSRAERERIEDMIELCHSIRRFLLETWISGHLLPTKRSSSL